MTPHLTPHPHLSSCSCKGEEKPSKAKQRPKNHFPIGMSKPLPKLLEWVNFQISIFFSKSQVKVAADAVKIIDYHASVYT